MKTPQLLLLALLSPLVASCVAARSGTPTEPSEATSDIRSPKELVLDALALLDGGGRENAEPLLGELERSQGKVPQPERGLIDALVPLVKKARTAPQGLSETDLRRVAELHARYAATSPKDFDIQLAAAVGMHRIESTSRDDSGVRVNTGSAARTSIARAEALAAAFPTEARAFAHLARVHDGSDSLASMRAYLKCAELDPHQRACRDGFRRLAEEWSRPRCVGLKDEAFAVHPAYEKPAAKRRRIVVEGQTLYMDPKPSLTGKHVEQLAEQKAVTTPQPVAANAPAPRRQYTLGFTPLATGRFADLTSKLADKGAYLAIRIGKDYVAAPRVISAFEGSTPLVVSTPKSLPLETLCAQFQSRPLPPDLARGPR